MPGFTTREIPLAAGEVLIDVSADGNMATVATVAATPAGFVGIAFSSLSAVNVSTGERTLIDTYAGPYTATAPLFDKATIGLSGGQLSSDGRFVLFGLGETAGFVKDVAIDSTLKIKDLFTGSVRTVAFDGSIGIRLRPVDIDGSGTKIVYNSLFLGDSDPSTFVLDTVTNTRQEFLSLGSFQSLSGDGRWLTDFVFAQGTILRDLQTGAVVDTPGLFFAPVDALSADGRYALMSRGSTDIFRFDRLTGSVLDIPGLASLDLRSYSLSENGRYVSALTGATLNNAPSGTWTTTLLDLETGQSISFDVLASALRSGQPTNNGTLVLQRGGALVEVNFGNPVVTLDTIAGDNILNAAEAAARVRIAGTADLVGGLVEIRASGSVLGQAIVAADQTWSLDIDLSGLAQGPAFLNARIEYFGKARTARSDLVVDTQAFVTVDPVTGDDVLNLAETGSALTGTSDAGGQTIRVLLDGALLGEVVADAQGFWNLALPGALADGTHRVDVTTIDAAGNPARTIRDFTVDRTPPTLAITTVGDNGSFTASGSSIVAGTSDAIGRTVTLLLNGSAAGLATVQADGTWSATIAAARIAGAITVEAQVTDAAGNVAQDSVLGFADRRFLRLTEGTNGEQAFSAPLDGLVYSVSDLPDFDATATLFAFSGFFLGLGPDPDPVAFTDEYIGRGFLKNLATGALIPVSPGVASGSLAPVLSPDGHFVAFVSRDSLLPADRNFGDGAFGGHDIYLKNLDTGALSLVSALPDGTAAGNSATTQLQVGFIDPARSIAVAEGGAVVAYIQQVQRPFGPGLAYTLPQLVVRDMVQGISTVLTSPDSPGDALAQHVSLSRSGDVVVWEATLNYGTQFTGTEPGAPVTTVVYGGNWRTGTVARLDTRADGTPIPRLSPFDGTALPVLSADGTAVAFESGGRLWLKRLDTGALTEVTRWDSAEATGIGFKAFLPDGRLVFSAGFDVPGVADAAGTDLFVFDPASGATRVIASGDVAIGASALSGNGDYLAVGSFDPLLAGDTNGQYDFYLAPLQPVGVTIDDVAPGVPGQPLALDGTATLVGTTVALFIDGTAAGTALVGADGRWSASLATTGLAAGPHQLRATVSDARGFTSSDGAALTLSAGGTVTGVVLDGYVVSATVFADADGDGVLDAGEARATTDAAGGFVLVGGGLPLVAFGGTDVATGLAQPHAWRAPAGFTAVTALSTLIAAAEAAGTPLDAVLAQFAALLPAAALLRTGDVLAAARAGDAAAQAQLLVIGQAASALSVGAAALAALPGAPADAYAALVAAVADQVMGAAAPLGLAGLDAAVADAVADVAPPAGSAAIAAAVAELLEDLRAAAGTPGGDAVGFLADLAAIARIAQGEAGPALAAAIAAGDPLDPVLAGFDGAALAARIDAVRTQLGDLDGPRVANAPIALDATAEVVRDGSVTGTLRGFDADGDTLTFRAPAEVPQGFTLETDGSWRYAPPAGITGQLAVLFTVNDGTSESGTATLLVDILPPTGAVDDLLRGTIAGGEIISLAALLANDAAGLTITGLVGGVEIAPGVVQVNRSNGSFVLDLAAQAIRFTHANSGPDLIAFDYTAADAGGTVSTATVQIRVDNHAPEAFDRSITVRPGVTTTVFLDDLVQGGGNRDQDGDPLVLAGYALVAPGALGSVAYFADRIEFTPAAGYAGGYAFDYVIQDAPDLLGAQRDAPLPGALLSFVPVVPTQPPVAGDDSLSVVHDRSLLIPFADLLGNDRDPDGAALTIVSVSGGPNGLVGFGPGGGLVYTPAARFAGRDSFRYEVSNGALSAFATVTVEVTNSAPVAVDESFVTRPNLGRILTLADLVGNAFDGDGDRLAITAVSTPQTGMILLLDGDTITYGPAPDFIGRDSFTYTISDGIASSTATVTFDIVNAAPIAVDDAFTTRPNLGRILTRDELVANDIDGDGDALNIIAVTAAPNGDVLLNGDNLLYRPRSGFIGRDSFTYTISDGTASSTATVTFDVVNNAPVVPITGPFDTRPEVPLNFDEFLVLRQASDADNDPLRLGTYAQPSHGTVILVGSTFEYRSEPGYAGPDSFDVFVTDGYTNSRGTVLINVVNSAPVAGVDGPFQVQANRAFIVGYDALLANDSDADRDPLSITFVFQPQHGRITLTDTRAIYEPARGYVGPDSYEYLLSDSYTTVRGTVLLDVGNTPPVAATDGPYDIRPGVPLSVDTSVLLTNDRDPDGDPLRIFGVVFAEHGTVDFDGRQFVYRSNPGYAGPDSFGYLLTDGIADVEGQVLVNVIGDAPVAAADSFTIRHGLTLTLPAAALLANDRDPQDDPLIVAAVTQPLHGTLTLQADGTYAYRPEDGFVGPDSFTYAAGDGTSQSAFVTVDIAVTNDAPLLGTPVATIAAGRAATLAPAALLAGATDPDNDPLTIIAVGSAVGGSVALVPGGVLFTADIGFVGAASFAFTVADGFGGSDAGVMRLAVLQAPSPGGGGVVRAGPSGGVVDLSFLAQPVRFAGGTGNDAMTGGSGTDTLRGGLGDDTLRGGDGDDIYVVDSAGDVVIEGPFGGIDRVRALVDWTLGENVEALALLGTAGLHGTGNAAANPIRGNPGDNLLLGLEGDDLLRGGEGADTLEGGAGSDRLLGGAGADLFRLGGPADGGDRVVDFIPGEDRIGLSAAGFGIGPGGPALNQGTAIGAGAQFLYASATGSLSWDADGEGGAAPILLLSLAGRPALSLADLVLV